MYVRTCVVELTFPAGKLFDSGKFPGKLSLAENFRWLSEISARKENTGFVPAKTFRENIPPWSLSFVIPIPYGVVLFAEEIFVMFDVS